MCTHDRLTYHRTSTLRVAGSLVYIEILFLKFYYSHGQCSWNDDDAISTWRFQKILSNFELVMNFGSFGQTTVDHQSLWIVLCATFRFVQMHGILWSKCNVASRHHVLCMMLKGIFVDASQMEPKICVFAWFFFENFKPNWKVMVQPSFGMIETLSHRTSLNSESGLLENDFFSSS